MIQSILWNLRIRTNLFEMEDKNLVDYENTMLESPASLVINLDADETCNEVSSVKTEQSTISMSSFNIFKETSTISENSCWYKMPNETTEILSVNQLPETNGVPCDIKEISDRSFDIDNILVNECHCYSPRHSTNTNSVYNALTYQTLGTGSQPKYEVSVNNLQYPALIMNSSMKITDKDQNCVEAKVYKRQDDKPPYTYVAMIIVAILNSEKKGLTLSGIREKLIEMFPFFKGEYTGWKNSVRHALSNSKCFYKVLVSDDLGISTTHVWKVHIKSVKSHTFNRQAKGTKYESYKPTLQEELGLPPFDDSSNEDTLEKDIELPPKPCFKCDSDSLAGSVSDDFLNARNDSIPTPQSTISDIDSAYSGVSDKRRKRDEDNLSTHQTTSAIIKQTTGYNYSLYGYQQNSQEEYHPSYYRSGYYNSSPLTFSDQWSRDLHQNGYQQQYRASATEFSNEFLVMRNLWWSYYSNGMVPSGFQPSQNTTCSEWYPSDALNLCKRDEQNK